MSNAFDRAKDLKARLEKKESDLREAESAQQKRNADWQGVLDKELEITEEVSNFNCGHWIVFIFDFSLKHFLFLRSVSDCFAIQI